MANKIKIKTSLQGDTVVVRALIEHPMDTGRQRDLDGELLPTHYIQILNFSIDGEEVFSANWTTAIARNPYVSFQFTGQSGQELKVYWQDNLDETGSKIHIID